MMRRIGRAGMLFVIMSVLGLALWSNTNRIYKWGDQQYIQLAKSYLSGKTYFLEKPGSWEDCVLAGGKYYWPLGPLPALFLLFPVQLGKLTYLQGDMQLSLLYGVFILGYIMARKTGYSVWHGLVLAFALCFASVYQIAAFVPWSWYLVNAVTVFLVMLSICEYLVFKRYWVIGILMGLVWTARFTAGIGLIFFILEVLWEKGDVKQKYLKLLQLTIPSILAGLVLLGYNQIRFGNMWDNGYKAANATIMNDTQRFEQINYGLFKLENIPTNFYYYFLKGLDPVTVDHKNLVGNTYVLRPPYVKISYPGVSFWIVSPVFIYIFRQKFKERTVKFAGITSLLILAVLLTYYGSGWKQTGPRYMMDLLPFLYLILLKSFPRARVPAGAQILIIVSVFLNIYLLDRVVWM